MEREEAIRRVKARFDRWALDDEDMKAIQTLIPELRESEDERIRKSLVEFLTEIKDISESGRTSWAIREKDAEMCKSFLDYLEKQKEQKPEHFELKAGKWYICHRAFCARADHLTVKEGERFQCEKDGIVKGFVIKEPEKYFKECSAPEPMEKEQKQEWSDEDADMLNCCISSIEEAKENRYAYKETDGDTSYDREIDWLNSLRPQPHTVSIKNATKFGNLEYERGVKDGIQSEKSRQWKPSEEQMKALEDAFRKDGGNEYRKIINSLYNDLQKLL